MLQVAWFIMQLITRAIYHLETTQLEPLNVQCPHPVYWKSTESRLEDHIDNVGEGDELPWLGILAPVFRPTLELVGYPEIPTSRKFRVPTFDGSINPEVSDKIVLQLAALLMTTIFGSIHCMTWFFGFPTYQEQVLWCMSAVAITCTLWLSILTACLVFFMNTHVSFLNAPCAMVVVDALHDMLYVAARAILLVLMFTTLRNLPPDAYKRCRGLVWCHTYYS
ncbi:hypothetical protein F4604DRAFT_1917439 [Suillus subluteus]|nr:hypothetical protein F4604DRAFT_1917439 [Suillus subluteus]